MKTKVYSVFDSKAAVYGTPFFMPNDKMAVRAFSDLVNTSDTMVNKHVEDFSLFCVGEFDDMSAMIISLVPINLATAASLVKFNSVGLIGNGFKEVKKEAIV